jgi:heavy metal sensor kinase
MKRLKTLRVRFALWTAGLLVIALLLFGFYVYANMSRNLASTLDESLRSTATQLVAEIDIRNGELVPVENLVDDPQFTQFRQYGFSMRVLNASGQTLQVYGPYKSLPQPQVAFSTADQAGLFTTITDAVSRDSIRVYSVPIIDDGRVEGILQVAQNLKGIRQTLNQLLATMLIGGLLMVIVAGGGGYFLAVRALTPIDKITRTARQISAQDLSARLNLTPTDDEVGRLADTLDSMLARLDDAFQRERRFTADASHELRTPLAAVQTILSSTLARQRTPAEYEQVLVDLGGETERLRTLVEGLLRLAHSDVAHPMAKDPVNLSNLLVDVTDSLRPLAEDKGLELTANISDNLSVTGDSDDLIRLFVNLLDNAIKYTQQGHISVVAGPQPNGCVEVTIADTGVGIAAAHLPYIFDRFYRVDQARATSGSGLGLSIALSIAQAHGGTIGVESNIGEGSVFRVQLAKEPS